MNNKLTSVNAKWFINLGWERLRMSDDALKLNSQNLPCLDPFTEIDTVEVDKILECAQPSELNKEFEEEKKIVVPRTVKMSQIGI